MKKILFAASESVPFIKTGGLADVVGSLPKYFDKEKYDVRVMLPKYMCMKDEWKEKLQYHTHFYMDLNWRKQYVGVLEMEYDGIKFYFIDNEYYFNGYAPYGDMYADIEKFAFFSKAVLSALPLIDFRPDIIHCHDWQTGLVPIYLDNFRYGNEFYRGIKTVMTIHNLKFQGTWDPKRVRDITGLPQYYFAPDKLEAYKDGNFLKGGIVFADAVTTVSNTYADEIKTPFYGEGLDGLLRDLIGEGYLTHPQELKKLEAYAGDKAVLQRLEDIKHQNKLAFAAFARKHQGVVLNTDAIFDVQVKRLHEYKRQLLNALQIIYLYQRLQDDPSLDLPPQTFLFGAKAAPGYAVAKRIIHLINSLADQINSDPLCKDRLQVVFLENYRVSLAEVLMPASEVSQQISTAGKEASGTGNMKFMMNGALTVGTLDGANVEMHDLLGDDNMFLFGLHADEVEHLRHTYDPNLLYQRDPVLRRVLDQLKVGFRDGVTYEDLFQRLVTGVDGQADQYMVLADFAAYCEAESRMRHTYRDRETWNRMSLTNIARSGVFAADRAISQYADTIWHVPYKQ